MVPIVYYVVVSLICRLVLSSEGEKKLTVTGVGIGDHYDKSKPEMSPNDTIYYREGQMIEYKCHCNSCSKVQWILSKSEKNGGVLFYGNKCSSANIRMLLYKFDNHSTLSCVWWELNAQDILTYTFDLHLILKKNSDVIKEDKQTVYVNLNKTFDMKCSKSSDSRLHSITPDNQYIDTKQFFMFQINSSMNGLTLYCVCKTNNTNCDTTERYVYNITKLKIIGVEPVKDAYDSLTQNEGLIIGSSVGVIVIVLVLFAIISYYCIKTWKRTVPEHIYDEPIVYANLQLPEHPGPPPIPTTSPYGTIIGYLAPKDGVPSVRRVLKT